MSDKLSKHTGGKHLGPARSSPYPVSRLAPPHDLIDVAKQIAQADQVLATSVNAKLQVIAEQIRFLQEQAKKILEAADEDRELHRASCTVRKRIGEIYYLYERSNHETYFSILSPADWNDTPPHPFIAAYRLEADMSWTPLDE